MIPRLRRWTRARRGRVFRAYLAEFPRPLRIVDLGGTVRFWEAWGVTEADGIEITLINNHIVDKTQLGYESRNAFIRNLMADALELGPERLSRFDLVFSNSFLEHLNSWENQQRMARAITESAVPYFMQTPNKYAPIDPHFPRAYVPFFALYPRRLQAWLLTLDTLGGGVRHASVAEALERMRYYNLLGWWEMRRLFPDAELRMERPLGVPMSILAYRRPSAVSGAGHPARKAPGGHAVRG